MTGSLNFRDLGGIQLSNGLQVRERMLFRSDGLSRLTEKDQQLFAKLNINTIIDLRHTEEIAKAPDKLPLYISITSHACGFYAKGTKELFQAVNSGQIDSLTSKKMMRNIYAKMPIKHTKEIQHIIRLLIDRNSTPCLIHCMSGKDRTGLVIAIILKAVGAPLSVIMHDYKMSNGEYQKVDVFGSKALPECVAAVMAAEESYLQASFDSIHEAYGTFENYLADGLMLNQKEIDKLTQILTQ